MHNKRVIVNFIIFSLGAVPRYLCSVCRLALSNHSTWRIMQLLISLHSATTFDLIGVWNKTLPVTAAVAFILAADTA